MLEVRTTQQIGSITFNYEEIKKNLEVELKKYDVVVTEDSIKEGKDLKATLNKVKKQVDDERKRIKKEYCLPLVEFENQVKDLCSMLDAGYRKIDDQIKVFEDNKKAERKKEIEEEYASFEIAKLIPFEKIFNPKWLNSNCSKKQCTEELLDKVNKIKNEMTLIKCFMPTDKADARQVQNLYLQTLDIGLAKAKADELIAIREQAQAEAQKEAQQQEIVAPKVEEDTFKEELDRDINKVLEQTFDVPKPTMKRVNAIMTGPVEFFNEMNALVKKYNAECKVLSKEVL